MASKFIIESPFTVADGVLVGALHALMNGGTVAGGGTGTGANPFPLLANGTPDLANATIPSPEGSTIENVGGKADGPAYLIDSKRTIWTLRTDVAPAFALGTAFAGNTQVGGGGSASGINEVTIAQGAAYVVVGSGQQQYYDPGRGSLYPATIPPLWTTPGGGTGGIPGLPALVPLPALPAIMPGSSGKTIQAGVGQTLLTLTAALATAVDGDTIKMAPGTYTEALDKIRVSIELDITGAIWDATSIPYASLAGGGMGLFVPTKPFKLLNGEIFGVGMKETGASNCCAVRHDAGANYVWVQGTNIHDNQSGIGGAGVGRTKVFATGVTLTNNGLGDGFTHNVYTGNDVDLELDNVISTKPNGGHAIKHRGPVFVWTGGAGDAVQATIIDRSDGSTTIDKITNVAFTKPASVANDGGNHGVIGYGMESQTNGMAGVSINGGSVAALCDNPLWQGTGGTIALAGVTLSGNPIVAAGGVVVTGT
jgi:hypothetical protein